VEHKIVGKSLEPSGLTNRQVANASIWKQDGVLAARHAVVPGLESLRGFIERTSRVTGIRASSGIVAMVMNPRAVFAFGVRKVGDCVTDRTPRLLLAKQSLLDL